MNPFKRKTTTTEYTRKDGIVVKTTITKGFLYEKKQTKFIRPERTAKV